ncbi:MAG: Xaa-Pro dipeptidase [Pseudomonadales bacterium]
MQSDTVRAAPTDVDQIPDPVLDGPAYREHLATLAGRWTEALAATGCDAAIIAAGEDRNYFLDDQPPPFRPNPHFAQWIPEGDCRQCALLIQPGERPQLFFFQPQDYWHQPPQLPQWAYEHMTVRAFSDPGALQDALASAAARTRHTAFIGESAPGNLPVSSVNPPALLNHLHYLRACKTPFELDCLRCAAARGVRGHLAARQAFLSGASEFAIHMRYLEAAQQVPAELPYSSIVALNEHAAVLHYQHYDRRPPARRRSFLIDAGASCRGYAADITRTYVVSAADLEAHASREAHGTFAALIDDLDQAQQQLIADIRPGQDYLALHEQAHRAIAAILANHSVVRCSAEQAFEQGLTETFLPHGLGHLIGLQTHDVGGTLSGADGSSRPPPARYPALRLTRRIEPGQVFTIEPGIYFIGQLLDAALAGSSGSLLNAPLIAALREYGGIRIEDNVHVTAGGADNLTRRAFAAQADG